MTDAPQIPPEMLDQILQDPEAVAAMQELANRAGITMPVADMPREEQIALVTAMMNLAQQQQTGNPPEGDGSPTAAPGLSDIPTDLIDQIFADPRAQPILHDIMSNNQLTGEPADLSPDIKTAIVRMLIDQGVISFDENG